MFTQYQDGALQSIDLQIWSINQQSWCNGECVELAEKYWPSLGNEYTISFSQIIWDQN